MKKRNIKKGHMIFGLLALFILIIYLPLVPLAQIGLRDSTLYFQIETSEDEIGITSISENNNEIETDVIVLPNITEFGFLDDSSGALTGRGFDPSIEKYVFVIYENGEWVVLYESEENFYLPTLFENKHLYLIRGDEKEKDLIRVDLKSMEEKKILTKKFNMESKLIVSENNTILFVAQERDEYESTSPTGEVTYHLPKDSIYHYKDGNVRKIVSGRCVNWITIDKEIIYAHNGSIIIYELESKKKRVICDDVVAASTIEVNADASMIAFGEFDSISIFVPEHGFYLSVMKIDVPKPYRVKQYIDSFRNGLFCVWEN